MLKEHKDIMEHVVLDPDAWYSHAVEVFGEEKALEFLKAKCARWKPDYEKAKVKGNYEPRAKREKKK